MQILLAIAANNPQLQNSFTGWSTWSVWKPNICSLCLCYDLQYLHFLIFQEHRDILSYRLLMHSPVIWFFSNLADATFSSFAESILRLINTVWQCFKILPHVFLLFLFSPMQLLWSQQHKQMAPLRAERSEAEGKKEIWIVYLPPSTLQVKGSCCLRDIKCDSLTEQTCL